MVFKTNFNCNTCNNKRGFSKKCNDFKKIINKKGNEIKICESRNRRSKIMKKLQRDIKRRKKELIYD